MIEAKLHHSYYLVASNDMVSHSVMGRLVSQRVSFKGVRYWAFQGHVMTHLVDPDDIEEIEEISPRW